jgi:hypothetical protein
MTVPHRGLKHNVVFIPGIHIVDLLSHYYIVAKRNASLSPKEACQLIRESLTDEDIRLIRDPNPGMGKKRWVVEFAGKAHRVSPGAKEYEQIAPYFMKLHRSNNCYAFAMDDLRGQRTDGSIPGSASQDPRRHDVNWQSCEVPKDMVLKDAKIVNHLRVKEHSTDEGHPGTYQVQFFVDRNGFNRKKSTDFHWYREVRPPAWIDHYLKNWRTYKRIQGEKKKELFVKEMELLLNNARGPESRIRFNHHTDQVHPKDVDRLQVYHGIRSYYGKPMGSDCFINGEDRRMFIRNSAKNFANSHSVRELPYAVYANKAGLSEILTICGRSGRILLNPRQAVRGYNNDIDYDLYCETFIVDTNRGISSLLERRNTPHLIRQGNNIHNKHVLTRSL